MLICYLYGEMRLASYKVVWFLLHVSGHLHRIALFVCCILLLNSRLLFASIIKIQEQITNSGLDGHWKEHFDSLSRLRGSPERGCSQAYALHLQDCRACSLDCCTRWRAVDDDAVCQCFCSRVFLAFLLSPRG